MHGIPLQKKNKKKTERSLWSLSVSLWSQSRISLFGLSVSIVSRICFSRSSNFSLCGLSVSVSLYLFGFLFIWSLCLYMVSNFGLSVIIMSRICFSSASNFSLYGLFVSIVSQTPCSLFPYMSRISVSMVSLSICPYNTFVVFMVASFCLSVPMASLFRCFVFSMVSLSRCLVVSMVSMVSLSWSLLWSLYLHNLCVICLSVFMVSLPL